MRLHVIHVRLACARKSYSNGVHSTKVRCNSANQFIVEFYSENRIEFSLFSLLATIERFEASQLLLLSIVANYSLFPLLFPHNLLWIKTSLHLLYLAVIVYAVHNLYRLKSWRDYLMAHELLYAMGFLGLFTYEQCLQFVFKLDQRLPFLPLLLTSVYCSIGITYFWLKYYLRFLLASESNASSISKNTAKKNNKLKKEN